MNDTLTPARATNHRDGIAAACAAATGAEFLDDVAERLRRVVPFSGAFWSAVDPVTTLAVSPALVENVSAASCQPWWESEFLVEDVLRFSDLVRSGQTVTTLHDVTDGHPRRSARYQHVNLANGFDDELRAVLRTGAHPWGMAVLYRGEGERPFTAAEQSFVAEVAEDLAHAFRRLALARPATLAGGDAPPGVMLFDATGRLLSASPTVAAWLDELPPSTPSSAQHGLPVPTEVFTVVGQARAVAAGRSSGLARARMLGRTGRWLVAHASVLVDTADPTGSNVAVVIEQAQPSEVVPIIVEAFGLTPRERDVVVCVTRGMDTGEVAAHLFLSAHTVRDHLKSVFEKVGVSSRGELVARLFSSVNDIGAHLDV